MNRIGVPTGGGPSAAELRRQRKADEAFERRCAEAAKQLEHVTNPDVLVAQLRNHEALDYAVTAAIERALASMSDATLARAEEYLARVLIAAATPWLRVASSPRADGHAAGRRR
ncbi:MAG TPA: hypothetical protein VFS56_06240 [Gemmatimonadaceae bacterium]|nr:hypothetical protein [Gemmatimonadaceae bacterium]